MNKLFVSDENVQLASQAPDWKIISSSSRELISCISKSSSEKFIFNETKSVMVLMISLKTLDMFASSVGIRQNNFADSLVLLVKTFKNIYNCTNIIVLKPDPIAKHSLLPFYADELNGYSKRNIYEFNSAIDLLSTQLTYLKALDLNGVLSLDDSRDVKNFLRTNSRFNYKNLRQFHELINIAVDSFGQITLPKVLALDLDNTLWSGILREDGLENINIGDLSPLGQLYYKFQELYKSLKDKGILLVLITKNYPDDVEKAFKRYYDMPLKLDDFIIVKASDEPKSSLLSSCALELNINLKHFMFIDDSSFERREVKANCPDVYVPDLPQNVYDWFLYLLNDACITALFNTFGDTLKTRTESYQIRAKRNIDQKNFLLDRSSDISGWLSSLNQVLKPCVLEKPTQRAFELLQRTNQFNTSGLRFTNEELIHLFTQSHTIFEFNLSDSYGDDGIVSVAIIDHSGNIPVLKNFVLSCRVFGRHVEHAILDYLLKWVSKTLATDTLQVNYSKLTTNKAATIFFDPLLDPSSCIIVENIRFNEKLIRVVE